MVTGYDGDGAIPTGRRHAERVPLTLDDEGRHRHVVELVKPALDGLAGRAPRWLEWECETEHSGRSDRVRGPAGDPRTERPAADDQRQPVELVPGQVLDDGDPGGVELVPRCGRAAACNAVRLLHERDAHASGERDLGSGDEISGGDAPARAMAEDERGPLVVGV